MIQFLGFLVRSARWLRRRSRQSQLRQKSAKGKADNAFILFASPTLRELSGFYRQNRRFPFGLTVPRSLVKQHTLIRTVQRERRYLNIKAIAALTLHLVGPAHHPRRCVEGRATRI